MIKRYRKNKLNGSVLYTVVAVMMIMTVFIFATLTLASAANRRAFNSYANNQTQYTARSVVDSMMKILRENGSAAVGSVDCDMLNASIDSSMGEVTSAEIKALDTIANLEKAGYNFGLNLSADKKNKYIVYKLSATVKMLGQENTVSLYCYNGKEDNPPLFKNALTIMGNVDFAPCDTIPVYGDVYTSIDNPVDVNVGKTNSQPLFINGAYGTKGNLLLYGGGNAGLRVNVDDFNKGVYVDKNVGLLGNSMRSELKFVKDVNNVSYTTLPYVFINGTFGGDFVDSENISQTSGKQNYMSIGDSNHPFIFMADSLGGQGAQDQFNAYGDVYLYSQTTPSYIMVNSESSGVESGVHSWNTGKVDAASPNGNFYTGGNIYSMGVLNTETYNQGTDGFCGGTLANNVLADSVNFLKTPGANDPATKYETTGSVVADSVNLAAAGSNCKYTFSGGLFTNNYNIASGQTVNGISYVGDYIDYNVEKVMLSGEREITDLVEYKQPKNVALIYKGDNEHYYKANGGTEILIHYNFSGYFSEDVFDKVNTRTNNVTIKEFTIDISALDELNYNGCKIGCEIDPLNGNQTQKFYVNYDLNNSTLSIPGDYFWALNSIEGEIRLHFYPDDRSQQYTSTDDEGKVISVNSLSIVLNVDIRRTGDIAVSGTDKLEFLKQVNDNAFSWNSNTIYIDDIDKSVKLEKDGSVMRISMANNENTLYTLVGEYDYNTQYVDFLNAVVTTVTFPDSMAKDKVIDTNGGFVSTSFKSEGYRKQIVSNAKTYADVKDKLENVNTYVAGFSQYDSGVGANVSVLKIIDKDGNKLQKTVEYDWGYWTETRVEDVVLKADKDHPITENCILTGTINETIYISPPNGQTIYIGLYDLKINYSRFIIVDDSGTGKVNFFVPKDGMNYYTIGQYDVNVSQKQTSDSGINWSEVEKAGVLTKSLFEKLYVDMGSYYDTTSAKINIADLTVKPPNVYFYFDNDAELNMKLGNGSLISGYIYGPNVNYSVKSGAYFSNGSYSSDDVIKINILGSGIFKSAFIEESNYVYIDESGGSSTPPEASDVGIFTTLYYQSF